MDFDVPPGARENLREIRGWWLGAETIHQNPRAGAMFAERLSAHLAPLPPFTLFSRTELKYYFTRKRQRVKRAYDYLSDDELDELMRQANKLDFARELGADKILSGRIVENLLSENRTFHWWHSSARIVVELTDATTGDVEWSKEYKGRRRFASQFAVQDEIAGRVARDLMREYLQPMAP